MTGVVVYTPVASVAKWFNAIPQVARYFISGNLGNIAFFVIDRLFYRYVVMSMVKSMPPVAPTAKAGMEMSSAANTFREVVTSLIRDHAETFSFFVSYLLQVIPQHALNCLLVFGVETVDTRQKYFRSLKGAYGAYSMSLVGCTLCKAYLMGQGVPRNVSFFVSLYGFAILNFFLLSMWEKSGSAAEKQLTPQRVKKGGAIVGTRGGAFDVVSKAETGSVCSHGGTSRRRKSKPLHGDAEEASKRDFAGAGLSSNNCSGPHRRTPEIGKHINAPKWILGGGPTSLSLPYASTSMPSSTPFLVKEKEDVIQFVRSSGRSDLSSQFSKDEHNGKVSVSPASRTSSSLSFPCFV